MKKSLHFKHLSQFSSSQTIPLNALNHCKNGMVVFALTLRSDNRKRNFCGGFPLDADHQLK
jgi:hypothetical protein